MWSGQFVKAWSKTVGVLALSSGESELAGVVRASTEGMTKLFNYSSPEETLEGTNREMVRFVFRYHETSINERFAREYLLKPPLEFHLTLPFLTDTTTTTHNTQPHTHHTHSHTHTHYTHTHTHIHIHIHRARQHTKTETGDTEELNSEGNEKRRSQRESRCEQWRHVWHGCRTETVG